MGDSPHHGVLRELHDPFPLPGSCFDTAAEAVDAVLRLRPPLRMRRRVLGRVGRHPQFSRSGEDNVATLPAPNTLSP